MFSIKIPRSDSILSSREDLFDALADLRGYGKSDILGSYVMGNLRGEAARRLEQEIREQSGLTEE
jgi:hypothetical protein